MLQQRISLLRDEGTRLAETLRAGELDAAETWSGAVTELETRMTAAIRRISEVDQSAMDSARQRLAALTAEAQRVDDAVIERTNAFQAEYRRRSAEAGEREAAALAALEQRLTAFDTQIAERQQEHLAHVSGLAERGDALALRLSELAQEMDRLTAQGLETQEGLSESAAELTARLAESRALIDDSGTRVARLTDESVRLLELIRSSAEHSGSDLPQALEQAERRLVAFEQRAGRCASSSPTPATRARRSSATSSLRNGADRPRSSSSKRSRRGWPSSPSARMRWRRRRATSSVRRSPRSSRRRAPC